MSKILEFINYIKQVMIDAEYVEKEEVIGDNKSPLPSEVSKVEQFNFYDALEKAANGSKITKLEWQNEEVFGVLENGRMTLHNVHGIHDWIISDGDLAGTDWIVL